MELFSVETNGTNEAKISAQVLNSAKSLDFSFFFLFVVVVEVFVCFLINQNGA